MENAKVPVMTTARPPVPGSSPAMDKFQQALANLDKMNAARLDQNAKLRPYTDAIRVYEAELQRLYDLVALKIRERKDDDANEYQIDSIRNDLFAAVEAYKKAADKEFGKSDPK